jgi:hypothetical protein
MDWRVTNLIKVGLGVVGSGCLVVHLLLPGHEIDTRTKAWHLLIDQYEYHLGMDMSPGIIGSAIAGTLSVATSGVSSA